MDGRPRRADAVASTKKRRRRRGRVSDPRRATGDVDRGRGGGGRERSGARRTSSCFASFSSSTTPAGSEIASARGVASARRHPTRFPPRARPETEAATSPGLVIPRDESVAARPARRDFAPTRAAFAAAQSDVEVIEDAVFAAGARDVRRACDGVAPTMRGTPPPALGIASEASARFASRKLRRVEIERSARDESDEKRSLTPTTAFKRATRLPWRVRNLLG